jgi:DNA/RNA endonuclease YhcR with UshA esterase domain
MLTRGIRIYFLNCFLLFSSSLYAWGPEGHGIVGRLALRFVRDDVRENILVLLQKMPIDSAANWMDNKRSETDYDFMKPWHYIDFPKEQVYTVSNDENIINRLRITYSELLHKKTLCTDQIRTDLFILLHLMGDLHMPLHNGYPNDLGGNKQIVQFDTVKTHNLHTFWDVDLIYLSRITDADCLAMYSKKELDSISKGDFVSWMQESRGLLPEVYDFPEVTLDRDYIQKSTVIVKKQLLKAAFRLAGLLNKLFASPEKDIDFTKITKTFQNGIQITDANKNIGKVVTVCSKVFGVRATPTITQINLGGAFPNNLLTIVIFGKSYKNFTSEMSERYQGKNVCVTGKIEMYKGKPQIIVENPNDIHIQ